MKKKLLLALTVICGGVCWAVLKQEPRTPEALGALIMFAFIWILGSGIILSGAVERDATDVNEVAHTPTINAADLIKALRREKTPRSKP